MAQQRFGSQSKRSLVRLAESLFSVFFPSDCRICENPLTNISRLPVCLACIAAMRPTSGTLCSVCGERLFSSHVVSLAGEMPKCGLCRRVETVYARATAYGSYAGGLRDLIHLLKYAGVRPAADVLGQMLSQAIDIIESELNDDRIAVVPVPIYRGGLHRRQFNQAELIAKAALKLRGSSSKMFLAPRILERKRETQSQTGLTSHQRRENVRGAFVVARRDLVVDREILVVDDVFTTGATVSECARVLRRAGASRVWVVTVARTMKIAGQQVDIKLGAASERLDVASRSMVVSGTDG